MTPAARLQAAIELLAEIAENPRPADGTVSAFFRARRYVGAKDRRAISERVYGVLRRRARLDWWIARVGTPSGGPMEDRDSRLRVLADLALTDKATPEEIQELFAQGPHAPEPLAPGERRFMGALAGKPLFHAEMPGWVRAEYPEWIEPLLAELFGENIPAEMGAMRDEAPLDLRANTLKATREQAIAALAAEGIEASPTKLSPLGLRLPARVSLMSLKAFRNGLVEVQDEGSQLVALLTGAAPGHAVVDFCAGAGGKTLALAASMKNSGRLVACDVGEGRINRAQERLRRAGVHNVSTRVLSSESDKWVKRAAQSYDRVLVDAPCTGTGTWRRNPDAKWRLKPETLADLTALQSRILDSAQRLVKPGGRLVYATCSILPAENEERVEAFLAAHPDFRAIPLPQAWTETLGTSCPFPGPWLRLSPLAQGTDGFFAAVLERQAEAS
ncbi:RsmB/NOP family class I SAM-dependent RNA methyltransferase [Telmatospirillum sp. J64-1]|uniref:RsmB/NOP family class I SAM-dependent RNA methyltransferase n=1 Tax=Telmatospirillum sp. J64-1 TaxID=2502183 RepID=UPI00115D0F77|nr:RsmB/NOP family class I SAM-dependent RNA methyltransferase [Telmatospirillum sp. J64-1]